MTMRCLFCTVCILLYFFAIDASTPFEATRDLPVTFQGRFRSLEPAARLWLYDFYHMQQLKQDQLQAFHTDQRSALELLWKVHFMGHSSIDDAPLFWIHYASLKTLLGLDPKEARFSFNELTHVLFENRESNLSALRRLLVYEYAKSYHAPTNRSRSEKIELRNLAEGLWVSRRGDRLIVAAAPTIAPWQFLQVGMALTEDPIDLVEIEKQDKQFSEELVQLFQALKNYADMGGSIKASDTPLVNALRRMELQAMTPEDIAREIETHYPLSQRLQRAGTTLKMLPSRYNEGEWLSLHALNITMYDAKLMKIVPVGNFTLFSDIHFQGLQLAYDELQKISQRYFSNDTTLGPNEVESAIDDFSNKMMIAYQTLADTKYKTAMGKGLYYPSLGQLKAETLYYRLPLIEFSIIGYGIALILFLAAYSLKNKTLNNWALGALLLGFLLHTSVLALRCYVLQRPPVSNMFETVVYVPWVAILIGLILRGFFRNTLVLVASCAGSLSLLILLKLTDVDARLENVQAVLDSQYWLIVHVLMVVGSYGVFVICGLLGHFFLVQCAWDRRESAATQFIAKCILHTMYIGVALLIPGTILGGVWAAESWGRFWDWDPKESWAFISACVFLIIIHAYTFRKIADLGLAIGSIVGLMAISFTWYGVNYILGTGLHSYGFGKGGEFYYFGYLLAETLFLGITTIIYLFFKSPKKYT